MKKYLLFCLPVLLFAFVTVNAQSIALPAECVTLLNQQYKGWKMANVDKESADYFKQQKYAYSPNLLKGDFNGDSKTDYAVLIQQTVKSKPTNLTIVFLGAAKGYQMLKMPDDGNQYIVFVKKGSEIPNDTP